jgi:hypothetical protein
MDNSQIDQIISQAEAIASGDYKTHEPTARNHAKLQALLVATNGELIKTIRSLDAKNGRLQKQVFLLSIIATIASIIALFK